MAGGLSGEMKESSLRAFPCLSAETSESGLDRDVDSSEFRVRVIDLIGNRVEAEIGVADFVGFCPAPRQTFVSAGLLDEKDLSARRNTKAARSLAEPLRVAMDDGARRALVPIETRGPSPTSPPTSSSTSTRCSAAT